MTEYNIDNEAAISAATANMEWDVYDKDGTLAIKKVTATQLQTFMQNSAASSFPAAALTTGAIQSGVIAAATMVGGDIVVYNNIGTTPGTLTTDTATNIIAALPAAKRVVGYGWMLEIHNGSGSANTATIAADASVTLTGSPTLTAAQNTTRVFACKITAIGTPAVTMFNCGLMAA